MARASKVDACMFCGNAPCTCNAPAKPAAKTRAPRKPSVPKADKPESAELSDSSISTSTQSSDVTSIHDAMRAASKKKQAAAPMTERQTMDAEQAELEGITSDPEMASAIRALGPILDRTEKIKYKELLNSPPSSAERAVTWRKKRDEVV